MMWIIGIAVWLVLLIFVWAIVRAGAIADERTRAAMREAGMVYRDGDYEYETSE